MRYAGGVLTVAEIRNEFSEDSLIVEMIQAGEYDFRNQDSVLLAVVKTGPGGRHFLELQGSGQEFLFYDLHSCILEVWQSR